MKRIALICETLEDGRTFLADNPTDCQVTLVPMRSLGRARGLLLDGVFSTRAARTNPRYEDALAATIPAALTSQWLGASVFEDG